MPAGMPLAACSSPSSLTHLGGDWQEVKRKIRQAALTLGFSHVGFARAERLDDAPLLEWLYRGYQGSMAWMERDPNVRVDPRILLPGCQTVICVALNYYTPYPTKAASLQGRISRYAWGRDYHKVIRKKLKRLSEKIGELAPNASLKICADSTPIQEKVWAQRAGIGWQGKHSNLITRDIGSWIFLGEILTDLALEPDPPHADLCGSCNRCMESCPTQAITAPYVVDANRCIAYHTIESHEPPPPEIADKTGDWIFGCDICQDVCPWNKFETTTDEKDFFPRLENQKPLSEWSQMSDEEFFAQFQGTPLMRAGRVHMAQNASIAQLNVAKAEKPRINIP